MDTYTSQYGNTNQGSALAMVQNALKTIQGTIPTPDVINKDMEQIKQNSGVTQDKETFRKIMELYAHDQDLAKKYQNPYTMPGGGGAGYTPPSDMPQYGSVGPTARPIMTMENVGKSFGGFTDPTLAAKMGMQEFEGVKGGLNDLYSLISKNYQTMQDQLKDKAAMYSAEMQTKSKAISDINDLYKTFTSMGISPLEARKLALQEREMGKGQVVQLGEDAYLVNPYTGEKKLLGKGKSTLTEAQKIKASELNTEREAKLTNIQNALALLKEGGIGTGWGTEARYSATNLPLVGGLLANEKEKEFYNILSTLSGEEMFKIGGKTIPISEKSVIRNMIPNLELSPENIESKLIQLYNKILNQYNDYNKTLGIEPDSDWG